MYPITTWDDKDWSNAEARGWSVMGRLRERQRDEQLRLKRALNLIDGDENMRMMTAGPDPSAMHGVIPAPGSEGPTVLAFLFSKPGSEAVKTLDSDGKYFDIRSSTSWDLFFPGYYRSVDPVREKRVGAKPVGSDHASDWFFREEDFDALRKHVQQASGRRWTYSGLTDLVLVCAWIDHQDGVVIDWDSTIAGSVSDVAGPEKLVLGQVIERISNDLENGTQDPSFGVGEVVGPPTGSGGLGGDTIRQALIITLTEIAVSMGIGAIGG